MTAVNKIEIRVAIGIVIKKDGTGSHRLNNMFMFGFTVAVFEVDARCFGDIHEDRRLCASIAYKDN
jgi:hypothetical protein